jgi:hypothetical protein
VLVLEEIVLVLNEMVLVLVLEDRATISSTNTSTAALSTSSGTSTSLSMPWKHGSMSDRDRRVERREKLFRCCYYICSQRLAKAGG